MLGFNPQDPKRKINFSKIILLFGGIFLLLASFAYTKPFFVFETMDARAFGHPDTLVPNVEITDPVPGAPRNPNFGDFDVEYTVTDNIAPTSCRRGIKNGGDPWIHE